jgi:prepilin-type N-terminal cleavage/methylation domain-containing protein
MRAIQLSGKSTSFLAFRGSCSVQRLNSRALSFHPRSCHIQTVKNDAPRRVHAFTLIELLVVTGLIAIMAGLAGPALVAIKGGQDVTKTAYDISGILDQARAYAMANNTYVYVGMEEVDGSKNSSITPQLSGVGRVALAVVASDDGTSDIDQNGNLVITGTNFTAISKVLLLEGTHLAAAGVLNGSSVAVNSDGSVGAGRMKRPAISTDYFVLASGTSSGAGAQFPWPLGATYNSSAARYNFNTVIDFDPQGVARIQTAGNSNTIGQYMEIGLLPAHGNVAPRTVPPNVAAIQIDAMTGATSIYRP